MPLAGWKEEWWVAVMEVGLDLVLTKWSMHLGLAIVLTERGYKEALLVGCFPSTTLVISSSITFIQMPSSFRTIPGTTNHLGISCAC